MSEYIRKRKIDTNECPNIYSWPIYSNIRIFEYIRHTLYQTKTYPPFTWWREKGPMNIPLIERVPPRTEVRIHPSIHMCPVLLKVHASNSIWWDSFLLRETRYSMRDKKYFYLRYRWQVFFVPHCILICCQCLVFVGWCFPARHVCNVLIWTEVWDVAHQLSCISKPNTHLLAIYLEINILYPEINILYPEINILYPETRQQ